MRGLSRKQLIVIAAGLVLSVAAIQWLIFPLLDHREKLTSRIERSEKRLQEMIHLEQTYRDVVGENTRVEEGLSGRKPNFTLFAFLESLASREGLKRNIEYMRPSVKSLGDKHQEEQVEMRLSGVTITGLIPYLYNIETAPEQVRIKRLSIRPQQKEQSLLEVNLVVVTHAFRESSATATNKT